MQLQALSGSGLVVADLVAICRNGRISPESLGAYTKRHLEVWRSLVDQIHSSSAAKIGITLNHAGRRGAVRPAREGLDRPLRQGAWPLTSASPLAFSPQNRTPRELNVEDMRTVCDSFVQAARLADQAGFDLLQVHMAHGYLLASFLSPLTNHRTDAYGGPLANRLKYPLEVFRAVRSVWPDSKPLAVALNVTDGVRSGLGVEESAQIAEKLKEQGCDLISILAGQTVPETALAYGRGFLTPLSDHIRNAAGIPTLVGGYLTTANQINTILAAGRGDLCLMYSLNSSSSST